MHCFITKYHGWRDAKLTIQLTDRASVGWSWNWLRGDLCGIGITADAGEGRVTFGFQIPWLLFFWFHVEAEWLIKLLRLDYESAKRREAFAVSKALQNTEVMASWCGPGDRIVPACYDMDRELGLRFHDKAVWWSLWWRKGYWQNTDPKWREGSFHYLDFLFGPMERTHETIDADFVEVPLPERSYGALVRLERSVWKRPRLPWVSVDKITADVRFDAKQPPVPGKGENSWDCEDDAIYALTVSDVKTIGEAVDKTVVTVLGRRGLGRRLARAKGKC